MKSLRGNISFAFLMNFYAVYFFLFMEWLFYLTKPSFMSCFSPVENFLILLASTLPLLLWIFLYLSPLALTSALIGNERIRQILQVPALLPAAAILSLSALMLFDNFTYTLFRRGIINASGALKAAYCAGLGLIFLYALYSLLRMSGRVSKERAVRLLLFTSAPLLLASLGALLINSLPQIRTGGGDSTSVEGPHKGLKPNILLIASDGWSASHARFYGYGRNTTPYLSRFIEGRGVLCENAFSNCAVTGGSLGSLLTGKLPTTTRVISAPDVYRGEDSYQHLPGLLKKRGYSSVHVSARYYADPHDFNLLEAFDVSNFKEYKRKRVELWWLSYLSRETVYFLRQIYERLESRLLHISGIREMENEYAIMTGRKRDYYGDQKRVEGLLNFLRSAPSPFLAHIHLMGTHGPRYFAGHSVFSAGQEQDEDWMPNFYDDALLDFDGHFKRIAEELKRTGRLDNTVIVLYSDHGMAWSTGVRIPLVFLFPGMKEQRRVRGNAQLIDITPTLLDYLGLALPPWLEGRSLLKKLPDEERPVFSVKSYGGREDTDGLWLNEGAEHGPPFYNLGRLEMVFCNRVYSLKLDPPRFSSYAVGGHTRPCPEKDLPDEEKALRMMKEHLARRHYDVSSLKAETLLAGRKKPKTR